MGIIFKIWSRVSLSQVGSLTMGKKLEDTACVDEFVTKVNLKSQGSHNVEMYWGEKLVQRIEGVESEKLGETMCGLLSAFLSALDDSQFCSSCHNLMEYEQVSDEIIEVFIPENNLRIKAQGMLEASCPDCKCKYIRFGTVLKLESV